MVVVVQEVPEVVSIDYGHYQEETTYTLVTILWEIGWITVENLIVEMVASIEELAIFVKNCHMSLVVFLWESYQRNSLLFVGLKNTKSSFICLFQILRGIPTLRLGVFCCYTAISALLHFIFQEEM